MAKPTKGGSRKPPPLNRFIPVDFETLQFVADNGQITIQFETDAQATNTKYRLWRLCRSLEAYAPEHPLTAKVGAFFFKCRKDVLTITDRNRSAEAFAQRQALQRKQEYVPLSADPMEIDPLPEFRRNDGVDDDEETDESGS